MDMINEGIINYEFLFKAKPYLKALPLDKLRSLTRVEARILIEDLFYNIYFQDKVESDNVTMQVGNETVSEYIDKELKASIYFLLAHDYEEPLISKKKYYYNYFIRSKVRELTGLSITEFINLTEKEARDIIKAVDDYNTKFLEEAKKHEKTTLNSIHG